MGETKLIKKRDKRLATALHKDEHIIIEKKKPKHGVKYYYLMVSWLYHDIKAQLDRIEKVILKKKRKPSVYNMFVAKKAKKGMDFKTIAILWKKEKRRKAQKKQ